jgi:hypothetical protein
VLFYYKQVLGLSGTLKGLAIAVSVEWNALYAAQYHVDLSQPQFSHAGHSRHSHGGMGGITSALVMVSFTYFWELDTLQVSLMLGGPPLVAVFIATGIVRTISNHALLADIADEHELETGQRREGALFAAAFFAAKFISGFGYLVAGPFLDLIGLQA